MEYLDSPKGYKSFKEYLKNVQGSPFYFLVKGSNEFQKLKDDNKKEYDETLKDEGMDDENDTKNAYRQFQQYANAGNG